MFKNIVIWLKKYFYNFGIIFIVSCQIGSCKFCEKKEERTDSASTTSEPDCGVTLPSEIEDASVQSYSASIYSVNNTDRKNFLSKKLNIIAKNNSELMDLTPNFIKSQSFNNSVDPIIPKGTEISFKVNAKCILDKFGNDLQKNVIDLSNHRDLSRALITKNIIKIADEEVKGNSPTFFNKIITPEDLNYSLINSMVLDDQCIEIAEFVTKENMIKLFADPTGDAIPDDDGFDSTGFSFYQNHLQSIQAADANFGIHKFYLGGSAINANVIIAIIDNGLDTDHPDLLNVQVTGKNMITGSNDPSHVAVGGESDDHGTHVAGLCCGEGDDSTTSATISGVMPYKARVKAYNVFNNSLESSPSTIAQAIKEAADVPVDIINMSLGGLGDSVVIGEALEYAAGKNVFIVAAAGNHGKELNSEVIVVPGSYAYSINGMVSVGSIDGVDNDISSFSNYSKTCVEIAAPGEYNGQGLASSRDSVIFGSNYGRMSGTSMASPLVAGAAGLIIGHLKAEGCAAPTNESVESILKSHNITESKLSEYVTDGMRLDIVSLKTYLDGFSGCP